MPATKRRALVIWAAAVAVYLLAVFNRTSLGVAGLQAAERFHVGPAALGVFTVLQVGVYAAMQIPTGLLVDRFGPRRVLVAAALAMGVGQLLFALAPTYSIAVIARGVLGFGDAMTFVSVLRLVAAHFSSRRYASIASLTAAVGSIGNLAATVPLTLLLSHAGWVATFAVTGSVTMVYAVVVGLRVRDTPEGAPAHRSDATTVRALLAQVRDAWRTPGTRLGFWVHFSTMFAPAVLGLLWGFPYLVSAQGMSESAAGAVLSLLVVVGGVTGPIVGETISRKPEWRVPMVAAFLALSIGVWAVLLGWPGGVVPVPLVIVAFSFVSLGGPLSGVGFAIARDYNPLFRVGTASGVVNVGGFAAITVTTLGIGLLLGGDAAAADANSFRVAFTTIAAMLLLGAWRTGVWWRRARALVLVAGARGEEVPVQIRRRSWDIPAHAGSVAS
ncbi:Major facilitator superfamily permease [Alloactinosynnema sp. L-07]|uniref:MFS transporter n=1 Tax=Alloactinosynnema sp. L-07 TaxID=1653480 RepID=UPI00065F0254|nr:MFS transporter [Alloactinosynnema sp. L-07]CRK58525.1 Major facilitator superfamily permease [Alloactinosynnema sp. L-07]